MTEHNEQETQNKTPEELSQMYDTLNEGIRHTLSAALMDTSEEHPMDVCIPLDTGATGLSDLEKNSIIRIFQDPTEGIIWVMVDFYDEYIEFDELTIEDKLQVVKDLAV